MKFNRSLLTNYFATALWSMWLMAWEAHAATNSVSQLWTQQYNSYCELRAMALDADGNAIATGRVTPGHILTVKYAGTSGALLWEKRHQNPANNAYGSAVAADRDGNVIVTGSSGADLYTAKYAAADGALLWEKTYNGPANLSDFAQALAVDTNGNVIVAGDADFLTDDLGELIQSRVYVAKYAAADGALMWEVLSPTNEWNEAAAVVVDAAGDVIVMGQSGGEDFLTVKYAGTNGTKLWERYYDGPDHDYDFPYALAVDAAGNVVVTGITDRSAAAWGYEMFDLPGGRGYTAKYAAADGAVLWEKRAPANTRSVGIDKSGNVFVLGTAHPDTNNGNIANFYTAKYAAADGALLWDKRHDATIDWAARLALDGNGNAIITGTAFSPLPYYNIHTLKYAAADGALLWEQRYAAGIPAPEHGVSVAVGAGGLVVASGDEFVTVAYRETLPPLSVARGANGNYQVSFTGTAGLTYRLQRGANVNGPWETLASSSALSGAIQFSDTNNPGQVFYRVAQP